tara:strand:- start:6945 stop:7229 length:285 start_codon:yes stop_codon:yes gene_type:complete
MSKTHGGKGQYMNFNINNFVKVKLTELGIHELQRQHNELYKHFSNIDIAPFKINKDEDGYTKFQLHDLIRSLGHVLYLTGPLPFDINIKIEVKE